MPTSFTFDNRVRISVTWEQDDAPIDPGTVVLRVEDPAGTVTTPTPLVNDTVGEYHYDLDAALAGIWEYRFEATSPKGAVEGFFIMEKSRIDTLNP